MRGSKPPAFIHVDVDSDQSLGNFYESPHVETNCVYERGLPRMMNFFSSFDIPVTFFVCGKDLSIQLNRGLVTQLSRQHHEIANHTFSHVNGFRKLSRTRQKEEIMRNTDIIQKVVGVRPIGFRAPGYDVDRGVLDRVTEAGYLYDASSYPSVLHPLLRWYLLLRRRRAVDPGYGSFWNAYGRTDIHRIGSLWEVPVSVFPIFRLPLHTNMTMHLPEWYARFGMFLIGALGQPFVFLFHAVEFVDQADHPDPHILIHPSFRLSLPQRIRHFEQSVRFLNEHFVLHRTDRYLKARR